jgi:hypothetical protein
MNLLVEPNYRAPLPPLGLLKIASMLRAQGETVQLVKGKVVTDRPEKIFVTSLFTWEWKVVWDAIRFYQSRFPDVEIVLGGIYASLMPDHAKKSGAKVHTGLYQDAEYVLPAYDLVPEWDGSLVFSSRGCIRACDFCPVRIIEGKIRQHVNSIKPYIWPSHTKIHLFDNNAISSPNWNVTWQELIELDKQVNIREGIDARIVTDDIAIQLSQLKLTKIQTAYDNINDRDAIQEGIRILKKHITRKVPWEAFVLYNWKDTPEEFFERIKDLASWGVSAFPMRYQPLNELKKNAYISPNWSKSDLKMVRTIVKQSGFNGLIINRPKRINFKDAKQFSDLSRVPGQRSLSDL